MKKNTLEKNKKPILLIILIAVIILVFSTFFISGQPPPPPPPPSDDPPEDPPESEGGAPAGTEYDLIQFVPPTPAEGEEVSELIVVKVSALTSVSRIHIYFKDILYKACSSGPCSIEIDTTLFDNGPAVIKATAYNGGTDEIKRDVEIKNPPPESPPGDDNRIELVPPTPENNANLYQNHFSVNATIIGVDPESCRLISNEIEYEMNMTGIRSCFITLTDLSHSTYVYHVSVRAENDTILSEERNLTLTATEPPPGNGGNGGGSSGGSSSPTPPPEPPKEPVCGDGICEQDEDCIEDCKKTPCSQGSTRCIPAAVEVCSSEGWSTKELCPGGCQLIDNEAKCKLKEKPPEITTEPPLNNTIIIIVTIIVIIVIASILLLIKRF
jgi:hypothetical protein